MNTAGRLAWSFLLIGACLPLLDLHAEPVQVRHSQGSSHGFVALSTLDGKRIATGDATSVLRGNRVTSRLVLRFRDGSIDDDTTVFTERRVFRLISDHHVQHGPSYPKPLDITIDAVKGLVTMRDADGKATEQHMDMPDDLSNGLPPNLLMNILPTTPETKLSFIAPMGKGRMIHASVKPNGKVGFMIGGTRRTAVDFQLHLELGGVTGVVAPILGKQPVNYHIWIMTGDAPAVIREEGQLYEGGPVWRIEQISPSFR